MVAIWMLFASGLVLGIWLLYSAYLGVSSTSWPTTHGRILQSEIVTRKNPASSSKMEYYHPIVVFEYVVNGKAVTSKRIGSYVAFGEKLEEAESIVSRFPAGSHVRVYYHPRFLRLAALMPGMKQPLVHGILGFTAIVVTGAAGAAIFSDNPFAFIEFIVRLVGGST